MSIKTTALKLLAFIYRKTGWYCPLARYWANQHIEQMMPKLTQRYFEHRDELSIENVISIERGLWQAKLGFIRPFVRKDFIRLKRFKNKHTKKYPL
jgi:hypothetical protein